ncbi:hypothetical protein ACFB49_44850 [Sphingomonas sp. DBB INV C78]|uniref:phytanoyl-CoA dioxygenase family protein n=1 Tax=Sphingomonas sp. DBB INV C78 TaxID=3349434 RepID=UPI0036D3A78C
MIPGRFASLVERGGLSADATRLLEDGYTIVRNAMPSGYMAVMSEELDERFIDTPFSVGAFHGERTKRFHQLLSRSSYSHRLVLHQRIMAMVRTVLSPWTDFPQLNLSQAVEIHPGAPGQIPHRDQAMFPLPKGSVEFSVNVLWPLCTFSETNGATQVWPNSHGDEMGHAPATGQPLVCSMVPGDALVFLGSTQHAAGANRSGLPRRGIIVSYCLGCLNPYENQALAYSRDFAKTLDPELAAMIGYRWHRPNLGTFDGQCPSILLNDEVPDHLATVDALIPEHARLVERHREVQQMA